MTSTLENPFLQFSLNISDSTWSLYTTKPGGGFLDGVWMKVTYRCRSGEFQALLNWRRPEITTRRINSALHGEMDSICLTLGPDQNGVTYEITFALPLSRPLFFWKVALIHNGKYPARIEKIDLLRAGYFPKKKLLPQAGALTYRTSLPPTGLGVIRPHPDPGEIAFFSHGWQSWSHSGVYGENDRYRYSRLGPFASQMWFNKDTEITRTKGVIPSDMFGILGDRSHRAGILAGFLSQKNQFGSLKAWCDRESPALCLTANGDKVLLDPGNRFETDWAVLNFIDLDDPDPLSEYMDAVSNEHEINDRYQSKDVYSGWCSWYQYFENLSAADITQNVNHLKQLQPSLPIKYIQIDDGYQKAVGDWDDFKSGFVDGVQPLTRDIESAGFDPGLWLAPFIVQPGSQAARNHPEWLLRNQLGIPVNAGYIWNTFTRALDLTHPEALDYACDVVNTAANKWGFPYLKLDFLYAAALPGMNHDQTLTRAQVIRRGLEALREAAGDDTILLGCGCPIGSGIGLVDAMRIGADVAPDWEPVYKGVKTFFKSEASMPSARNAIQNIFSRSAFNQRLWRNDPDCLILRSESNLTLEEVQSLATAVSLSGGSVFLSDNIEELTAERLNIAEVLFPVIGQTPWVIDWFDESMPSLIRIDLENISGSWSILGVFNWHDQTMDRSLNLEEFHIDPKSEYWVRSFWENKTSLIDDGLLKLKNMNPHGVRLLSVRKVLKNQAQYLGSNLHISQGLELIHWETKSGGVKFSVERPGKISGEIELYFPGLLNQVVVNQEKTSYNNTIPGCYRIELNTNQRATIIVN